MSEEKKVPAINSRQKLTALVAGAIKGGFSPWQKPVSPRHISVCNGISDRAYTEPFNVLALLASAASKGLTDVRWITFNQAKDAGWKVEGKSSPIFYWKAVFVDIDPVDSEANDGEDTVKQKRVFALRSLGLHNMSEIKGAPAFDESQLKAYNPIVDGKAIIDGFSNDGLSIKTADVSEPTYILSSDTLFVPENADMESAPYLARVIHEMAHATAHPSRSDRLVSGFLATDISNESKRAYEELVVSIASLQVAAETGLPYIFSDHEKYLDEWVKLLESSDNVILYASRDAKSVVNALMQHAQLRQKDDAKQEITPSVTEEVADDMKFD